jgi:hypothetical protein
MFLTTESTRIQSPLPRGMHMWKAVEIELLVPLVLASMTQREAATELSVAHTFLVLPDHLAALLLISSLSGLTFCRRHT